MNIGFENRNDAEIEYRTRLGSGLLRLNVPILVMIFPKKNGAILFNDIDQTYSMAMFDNQNRVINLSIRLSKKHWFEAAKTKYSALLLEVFYAEEKLVYQPVSGWASGPPVNFSIDTRAHVGKNSSFQKC